MSFVLLFYASEQVFERAFLLRFLVLFAFAVGMYGVGTSWVHNSFQSVGDLSGTISVWITALFVLAAAILFSGILGVIQEIWALRPRFIETEKDTMTLVRKPSSAHRRYSVFGTVFGWMVFEFLNTLIEWELSFPWLLAGYAFIDTWLVGFATVGGVTLVSFFVLITASALYRIRRIRLLTIVLAVIPWLLAVVLLNVPWTRPVEEKEVALIQNNFSIMEKMEEDGPTHSWRTNTRLTLEADGVDLVIWPEVAIHSFLTQELVYSLYSLAARVDASVVTGTLSLTNSRDGESVIHNIAVGVTKYEPEYQEYQKTKMAPFGEIIPFKPVLEPIVKWLQLPVNAIGPGIGTQHNMDLDGLDVGITICYEIAFPSYVAARSKNSGILVTISEDAWMGNSVGPAQHMQIARMRAVETGRYLARATTRGISGIVDPRGKLIATMPANQQGVVRGTVQTMEGETWFVRYLSGMTGWLWGVLVLLGGGMVSAFGGVVGLLFLRQIFFREVDKVDDESAPDKVSEGDTDTGEETEPENDRH